MLFAFNVYLIKDFVFNVLCFFFLMFVFLKFFVFNAYALMFLMFLMFFNVFVLMQLLKIFRDCVNNILQWFFTHW